MNKDNFVIQLGVALILVAIVGLIILKSLGSSSESSLPQPQLVMEANTLPEQNQENTQPRLTENMNSDQVNTVKAYFRAMANNDYTDACTYTTSCNQSNPTAVQLFSTEHQKYPNGYEYVNVRDLGFVAPSGKDIVCVKYSYRLKNDADPRLISEVMSFYTQNVDGRIQITDRVCEKKYKEGSGERPCPIEPNARYCVGNIK